MNYKISVIVPVYNMAQYIQECLDTILNQSLKDIEIICVNDGSTDESEKIIKHNQEIDNRVHLINKENGGAASARNAALSVAKGEYVAFMDPDDWYPERDILEVLYTKAKEHGVMICGGSFSELSEKNGLVTQFLGTRSKYTFLEDKIMTYKEYQFDYGYHRFIYNLDFLKSNNIFFPPYLRYQDPPFFVKAMICAESFYSMKKIVYQYRVGHQNVNWTERKLIDLLKGLRDNIKMSGENSLGELHKITLERLGKNYKDMYASKIKECSSEMLRLLMEIDSLIQPELLKEQNGEQYIEVVPDIIKRAIALQKKQDDIEMQKLKKKNRELKKKIRKMKESRSFKVGLAITWIPRKLKKIFTIIRK